jgi:hypothetical protein
MKFVGPIAASAGVQFEETAAAIGLLGNAGIQGSMAGTTLRGAIAALVNPGNKAKMAMRQLGLSATDSTGRLRPLNEIIDQLAKSGATTAQLMTIFGQRAGPGMAALVSQGGDALRELTASLEASGGTAQQIADVQMEGLAGAMLRLKSAFEGAMIALAESGLLDTATTLVEMLAKAFGFAADAIGKVPAPLGAAALALAALAAAAGPALVTASALIGAYTRVSASLLAVAGSAKVVKIALVSTGIGAVLVAVGTALAVFAMGSGTASRAAREFHESLKDQHGQLVENHRQLILNRLEESGVAELARRSGISVSGLTEAYARGAGALDVYIAALNRKADAEEGSFGIAGGQSTHPAAKAAEALQIEADAMRDNAAAAIEMEQTVRDVEHAKFRAAAASGNLSKLIAEQKTVVDPLTAAMLELADGTDDVVDSFLILEGLLDRRAGVRNYQAALDNLLDSIEKNGDAFGKNTEEARNNEAALDNVFKTAMNVANGALSARGRISSMERAMADADKTMQAMGMSDDARARLLQPFVDAIAQMTDAEVAAGRVRAAMDRIPSEKTVYIKFLTNFDALPARAKSEFKNAASGGLVVGPGGPRADRVGPYMLSNGEFVVQASSVKKFGAQFFEQLNAGISPLKGMDTPGPSRTPESVSTSGGRSLVIQNLNVNAAPGERAESSVPRSLRRLAWVSGLDG